ncbi:unnamed protein product [Clonostachys solani]|uniref:Uncharacterized protein n=1 Tax=Clonostachys solani TaxID=160281 RepID=A0A9N9Z192_9HYPO|nr:unnamed protein product [Clonostachys solani]
MPFKSVTTGFISTCGLETTHSVSGLFCDVMKAESKLQLLGMTWQPIPLDSLDDAPVPAIPALRRYEPEKFLLGRHPQDPFLSKAAFYGASTLQIQNCGRRCIGILAEMQDGSRIILGQWDPSREESISTLYEKQSGPLDAITFVFSDGDDENRYVENITLQNSDGAKPHFTWCDLRTTAEVEGYLSSEQIKSSFIRKSPFPRGIWKNLLLPLHLYRIRALNPRLHLVRLPLLERPPAVAVKLDRHLRLQRDAPAGGNSTRPPPLVAVGGQHAPVAVRVLQQVLDGLLGPRLAFLALLDFGEEGRRAARDPEVGISRGVVEHAEGRDGGGDDGGAGLGQGKDPK